MVKIKEIIKKIETIAPLETQEDWDNSGWQIRSDKKTAKKILIALNITDNVVEQAVKNGCDLIISHHPLIFSPIKSIKPGPIMKAIQNNIDIYSTHTNFDRCVCGTTATLGQKLGFEEVVNVNDFVQCAKLQNPLSANEFAECIKKNLNLSHIKCANFDPLLKIDSAAFCAGAGAEFAKEAKKFGADCFITGDVKYHEAIDSELLIFDIGHFESEVIALQAIKNLLSDFDTEIIIADEEPVFEIL